MSKRYVTKFALTGSVNDSCEAQKYLDEDDMTQYVPGYIKPLLISVHWELLHCDSGYVIVDAKEELPDEILEKLSSWISGQNSDGLGEGFEQQDFAQDYDDWDERYYMCSFDWETNDYKLSPIEEIDKWERADIESYCGKLEE